MILKRFEALQSFLATPRKIVVVGHRNPDGDAMGSTLALSHYLKKKNHTVHVVVPNEYPSSYIGFQVLKRHIVLICKTVSLKGSSENQKLFFSDSRMTL